MERVFVVVCVINDGRWTKMDSPSLMPHSTSASSTGESTRNGAIVNRSRARENFIAPEPVRLGCDDTVVHVALGWESVCALVC